MKTGKKLLTIATCLWITLAVGFAVGYGVDWFQTVATTTQWVWF